MKSCILIAFILSFLSGIGQSTNAIHFTVKEGLPSSTTYCVAQDHRGFIWIGTDAGLVRYDGTDFKTFTTKDGLPDNEVLGLMFDDQTDRLWLITYCKEASYYKSGKIYTRQNDSSLNVIKCDFGEFINGNKQYGRGEFLINASSIYEYANNKIQKTIIPEAPIFQVHRWNDKMFDVLTDSGVIGYNNHIRTTYPAYERNMISNRGKWVDSLLIRYTIGEVQLYKKEPSGDYTLENKIMLDSNKLASNVTLSGDHYLVCIWSKGLYAVDTGQLTKIKTLWSGNINDFYEDISGNIWITTNDDGLYVLKKQNSLNYNSANGIVHDNISSIYYDKDSGLYFGNTNGDLYLIRDNKIRNLHLKGFDNLQRIRGILTYGHHLFFISNYLISDFDLTSQTAFIIPHRAGGPKDILKLADGKTILIGLIASMMEYNVETKTFWEPQDFFKRVVTIAQHPDGRVFCGSLDGIYLYSNRKLTKVQDKEGLLSKRISSLTFTPDSLFWIGTASDGVMVYNGKKVVGYMNSTTQPGYRGAICRKIIAGQNHEVWIATNSGINKVRYHLGDSIIVDNITPLTTQDGLLSDDVNDILLQNGNLYCATAHGLSVLNVNELSAPRDIPVYIMGVRVNDKDSAIHDAYQLGYSLNNLQIQYIGVSLLSGGYIRYQYRLIGSSDEKWTTTSNTSVDLRALSFGKYTFEVTVLDKFGNRSKQIARVNFVIHPAIYQTIWFWSILFICFLGLGFYLIRLRFERTQKRVEFEQGLNNKIIDLEQQALKAQMNPHFIFNCLTAIQHFVNQEDVYSANMYLSNFSRLIRKTLDLSGEQYITLDKEVAYLQNYIELEKMRFQEKFVFSITVADDIDVYGAIVPPMLLQPIIENAIRHGLRNKDGNEGILTLDFTKKGNDIICTIDDNGVGIKRSIEIKTTSHVEYQSKGMKLTESRIAAINMISHNKIHMQVFSKHNDHGEATGTTVTLIFEQ